MLNVPIKGEREIGVRPTQVWDRLATVLSGVGSSLRPGEVIELRSPLAEAPEGSEPDRIRVVAVQRHRRLALETADTGKAGGHADLELEPSGSGTLVRLRAGLRLPGGPLPRFASLLFPRRYRLIRADIASYALAEIEILATDGNAQLPQNPFRHLPIVGKKLDSSNDEPLLLSLYQATTADDAASAP
ncbi:SRPBCC family protein [Phytoactinopolyspora mesophila]|uniref:Uncharacterized protein n=1 Tax=Phytoactinopolyspora mesophila TaxID=2650750 RepID=A0A7K3M623_9ACTN|nr:SRPBCC family protein [Phytoactinopolyspora mesophila]NDL58769.1 hypothetical protein [Phytoactinopolyspora mesophila]